MKKVLKPEEVLYDFNISNNEKIEGEFVLPQYMAAYKTIKTSLLLDKDGYNIYLVDEFCKNRISHIISYVEHIFKDKSSAGDICYVVKEEPKEPIPIAVNNGYGNKLKAVLDKVQDFYADNVFKFYNGLDNKEKEELISIIKDRRSKIVGELIDMSKSFGFDIKTSGEAFTFIPLNMGREMTEDEYDDLAEDEKSKITNSINELKISANDILEKLRNMKDDEINRIREIMQSFFEEEMKSLKKEIKKILQKDKSAMEYISYVIKSIETNLKDNYSISYEDDEATIKEIIYKYDINVVVDNSKLRFPPVIFDDDPSVSNLIGTIEYENHNNVYVSTIRSIKVGSYARANGGCLIIRASSILSNPQSYHYLKKCLITEKVDLDYNRGYLELFTLGNLKPVPMKINTKVIIIGDYETYDALYNYDKEFKTIFKMRAEYKGMLQCDDENKAILMKEIDEFVKSNDIKNITFSGTREIAKFLARKAENRNKIYFDYDEISNLLLLGNQRALEEEREFIDGKDIENVAYKKEIIEDEYLNLYEDGRILIDVKGSKVGQINGLSVIDTGYTSFGKPVRITCTCFNGDGKIIDAQRESNLSGKIHTKGISVLKGYINNLNGGYKKLPVDFNLSFEQLYGVIDGDSASVAEAVCIVSALCKIPIKQNIGITGSINQFGQVQAIGGVNEKIEGFFSVCKIMGNINNKGVIIPLSNKEDLVLSTEVEKAIVDGEFTIYTVENVADAMEIIYDVDGINYQGVIELINKECEAYPTE